jgi:hypothetical protein
LFLSAIGITPIYNKLLFVCISGFYRFRGMFTDTSMGFRLQ